MENPPSSKLNILHTDRQMHTGNYMNVRFSGQQAVMKNTNTQLLTQHILKFSHRIMTPAQRFKHTQISWQQWLLVSRPAHVTGWYGVD